MAENVPVLSYEKSNEEHLENQADHLDDIYGVDFLLDEYVVLVDVFSLLFTQQVLPLLVLNIFIDDRHQHTILKVFIELADSEGFEEPQEFQCLATD